MTERRGEIGVSVGLRVLVFVDEVAWDQASEKRPILAELVHDQLWRVLEFDEAETLIEGWYEVGRSPARRMDMATGYDPDEPSESDRVGGPPKCVCGQPFDGLVAVERTSQRYSFDPQAASGTGKVVPELHNSEYLGIENRVRWSCSACGHMGDPIRQWEIPRWLEFPW